MDSARTIANIGRQTGVSEQNMQHFISESPWSGWAMIERVQDAILANGAFAQDSVLLLDESADAKAGTTTVGVGRQHNGRLGKVDVSQVGVFLTLARGSLCTWIDGELFLPEAWFEISQAAERQRAGVPSERRFQTKPALGWQMIARVKARGLPFEAVACDSLYGRSPWLRDQCTAEGIECYSDVPANSLVYLSQPVIGLPTAKQARNQQVLSPCPTRVDRLAQLPDTLWQTLRLRAGERGYIDADFAARRVWTVRDDLSVHEEWLLLRRDSRITYTLSNAVADTPLATLARRKSARYFAERSNQDAKSELGWDEFQATKWRAWEHQLALTILAGWFITETKLEWQAEYARDPALWDHYQTEVLPALSVANVRQLLRAALPLPQLSSLQAAELVVKHLDNRSRSRRSRLKHRSGP